MSWQQFIVTIVQLETTHIAKVMSTQENNEALYKLSDKLTE